MKIGLLGYGTIGSSVYELLKNEIVMVFDIEEKRHLIKDAIFTSSAYDIVSSPLIDTVIECLGGDSLPYELIKTSLLNGKNVITSNKEVVSNHLPEFINLSKENNVSFFFEASVGGGVPIINNLIDLVNVDGVNHIYGIINGTTNYILTKISEGLSFDEALDLAMKNGFAERDPSADLEGLDLRRKISILSSIAYKSYIKDEDIKTTPMTFINKDLMAKVKSLGYSIKYIAESIKSGNEIKIVVEPVLFKSIDLISNVNDEFNMIIINTLNNGLLSFYGKGAGKYPTASSIVQDLERIKKGIKQNIILNDNLIIKNDTKSLYLRYKDGEINFTSKFSDDAIYLRVGPYEEI